MKASFFLFFFWHFFWQKKWPQTGKKVHGKLKMNAAFFFRQKRHFFFRQKHIFLSRGHFFSSRGSFFMSTARTHVDMLSSMLYSCTRLHAVRTAAARTVLRARTIRYLASYYSTTCSMYSRYRCTRSSYSCSTVLQL